MGISYNNSIVTSGLVLCLDAANPRSYPLSGNTWLDLSGQGNNGTLTNGPTFNTNNGGSLVFDGSNDYIDINSVTFNTQLVYSCSFWAKLSSNSTLQYLIDLRNADSLGQGSLIAYNYNNSNKIHYTVYGDGGIWIPASTVLSLSTWYNVVAVHDSSVNNIKIYINSVNALNSSFSTDLTVFSAPIRIGARRFTGGSPMTGNISNLMLYNRALSADEVRRNYNATRGRYGY